MALSRERIADELSKLLGVPDPGLTVETMIGRGILKPVLPEMEDAAPLNALIAQERALGIEPDRWRRLAALLPSDPALVERVAARLRLSKASSARLICVAGRSEADKEVPARALAYWHGVACARDRLLLGIGPPDGQELLGLESWDRPRLPFGGGELIARGLAPSPLVARTLQAIERAWVEAGFPNGPGLHEIVSDQLAGALRSSQ